MRRARQCQRPLPRNVWVRCPFLGVPLVHVVSGGERVPPETMRRYDMPQYVALTYTQDVDWTDPDQAAELAEYLEFGQVAAAVMRGGAALYPTTTATTV